MRIKQGTKTVKLDTKNWPLIVDLFENWGYPEEILNEAKVNNTITLIVKDVNAVTKELSDWEIQWKREY